MKLPILLIFLISFIGVLSAQEKSYVLLSVSGEVQIRGANALTWERAKPGRLLQDRETLRSGNEATARIQTLDGKVFVLPENAQIEIRELRLLSRDQVVLELTALDMQKLPAKKDSTPKPQSAFILHGAWPDSVAQPNDANTRDYLRHEERGALALFAQGYYAGFIMKWNRLLNTFPNFASEPVEAALIKAYEAMGMPYRMQQARERYQKHLHK